jgi:hypothetical protein
MSMLGRQQDQNYINIARCLPRWAAVFAGRELWFSMDGGARLPRCAGVSVRGWRCRTSRMASVTRSLVIACGPSGCWSGGAGVHGVLLAARVSASSVPVPCLAAVDEQEQLAPNASAPVMDRMQPEMKAGLARTGLRS